MLVNGGLEANAENTWILYYPNSILNGIIMDFGDNYGFVSAYDTDFDYDELCGELLGEGVEQVWVAEEGLDLTEPPHCWVVQSVIKAINKSLGEMTGCE